MTFFGKLSKEEQKVRTLTALVAVFQRMMRITTRKPVITKVVEAENDPHAAWTVQDGRGPDVVHFNAPQVGNLDTAADVVRLTGLGHHERCHISYTPLIPDDVRHPIAAQFMQYGDQAMQAFNILEDQRIETHDVALYPSARHYYASAVAGYILGGSEDEIKLAWLLVHGRRYLGQQIRDALEAEFKYPQHIPEAKRIIDEYRLLNLFQHGDLHRAGQLVEQMRNLLFDKLPEQPAQDHHAKPVMVAVKVPKPSAADQEANSTANARVRVGRDEPSEENAEGEGGGGSGEDWELGDEGEDEGSGGGGEDGEDGDEGEGGDNGSRGRTESKGGGGSGAGHGGGPADKATADAVQELLAAIVASALQSETVRADTKRSMDAVRKNEHNDTIGNHRGFVKDHRPDTVIAARTMARRLEKMKADLDPGWQTHESSGRLSVRRVAVKNPRFDEAFDTWTEGATDAADIETVIIGDVSGSMSRHVRQLSDAMWSMKAGHDKIGASCTVYAFDDQGYLVWRANEKARIGQFPHVPATGGTDPKRVLVEAARILSASQRKRKLFVAMTDGIWSDGDRWDYVQRRYVKSTITNDEIIEEMNGHGVLTAMVFLTGARDTPSNKIDWHGTQIHRPMSDLSEFAPFGDELLRTIMKRR